MSGALSNVSRRAVLGGLGAAAAGAALLPGAATSAAGLSATRRQRVLGPSLGAAAVFPTVFKHLRLPASAFRPSSSVAVWQVAGGALRASGPSTYTAPVVLAEGDLIEELDVVLDPGGHTDAIAFSRFRPGTVESLVTGTYPATSGVTTVYLPLPERPHIAEPSAWSYEVTIGLTTGVTFHSAAIEFFSGSRTLVLIVPVRVWDSRDADPYKLVPGVSQPGKLAGGNSIGFSLQGVVPTYNGGALVNVTLDQTEGSGFLTVYGSGEGGDAPSTSNLNWYGTNQVVANLVVTKLGGEAGLSIRAGGPGRTQVIVDVLGYLI